MRKKKKSEKELAEQVLVCDNSVEDGIIELSPRRRSGRRLVDLDYCLEQIKELNNHDTVNLGCNFNDMVLIRETRRGFNSILTFKCRMCNAEKTIQTEDKCSPKLDAKTAAVSGKTFRNHQSKVSVGLHEISEESMEEKRLALEDGFVDSEGIPVITVVVMVPMASGLIATTTNHYME
ncbi:hypothetical protein B566_EDAN017279 [Ephemera danica]|nr:hypothetical protein B566_EDAN017279 [Ephemera danica]